MWKVLLVNELVTTLVALAIFDLKYFILPDRLLGIFFVFSLLLKGLPGVFLSLYGIFTFLGISLGLKVGYCLWKHREGLGWGDVKFLTLAGVWVPLEEVPLFLVLLGGCGCFLGRYWKYSGRGERFPLGCLISGILGGWVVYRGMQ